MPKVSFSKAVAQESKRHPEATAPKAAKTVAAPKTTPPAPVETQVVDTPDEDLKIETQVGSGPVVEQGPEVEDVADEVAEEQTQAVAVRNDENALAAYDADADDVEASELVFPSLTLMNALSANVEEFGNGNFVIDQEVGLSRELEIIVLWFFPTRFVEKVEGGGLGEIASTEQEVAELGGTVHYNEAKSTGKPLFQKLATCIILIKAPEDVDDPIFSLSYEGSEEETGNYALCKWNLKASAYTGCARRIKTVRKTGQLRECGYNGGWWKIEAKEKQAPGGKSKYWSPVPRFAGLTSQEFRSWIAKEVLGN